MKIATTHRISNSEPSYEEVKKMVGGMVEIAYDDGKTQIICNEEGKLHGLGYNAEATLTWNTLLSENKGIDNNLDLLVGDVVILTGDALWK